MNNLKASLLILVLLIMSLGFTSLTNVENNETIKIEHLIPDSSNWVAPASANDMINPLEVNDETIAEGLIVYKRNCRSCHGRKGDGQGVEAAELMTPTTDFTITSFNDQSDGSMYWKIAEGKDEMEAFKDILDEDEIWAVVVYIKTFSQPATECIVSAKSELFTSQI
tara:strand:+ start:883 stop:1383 length:501 start_codon:yes stop_codon:yes gene_type:complete